MNGIKRCIAIMSVIILTASSASAQETNGWPHTWNTTSLYVSTLPGFTTVFNLSFDFMASSRKTHNGITTGMTVSTYDGFSSSDLGLHLTYTFLSGKGNNHFEAKLGGVVNLFSLSGNNSVYTDVVPVITIGYRYQPPDEKNFFRVGLSTAGIGFGFGTIISSRYE